MDTCAFFVSYFCSVFYPETAQEPQVKKIIIYRISHSKRRHIEKKDIIHIIKQNRIIDVMPCFFFFFFLVGINMELMTSWIIFFKVNNEQAVHAWQRGGSKLLVFFICIPSAGRTFFVGR